MKFKFYKAKIWDALSPDENGDYAKAEDLKKALELLRECQFVLYEGDWYNQVAIKEKLSSFLKEEK